MKTLCKLRVQFEIHVLKSIFFQCGKHSFKLTFCHMASFSRFSFLSETIENTMLCVISISRIIMIKNSFYFENLESSKNVGLTYYFIFIS